MESFLPQGVFTSLSQQRGLSFCYCVELKRRTKIGWISAGNTFSGSCSTTRHSKLLFFFSLCSFRNRNLYVYMQRFGVDTNRWVWPVMCGSVLIQTVYAGEKKVKTCLISRLSCERAGTRSVLANRSFVASITNSKSLSKFDDSLIAK